MRTSVWVILLANIFPIAGVLFFGWGLMDILFLYWMESGIIALFTIVKVFLAEEGQMKEYVSAAFLGFHFAVFMLLHLLLISFIFGSFGSVSLGTLGVVSYAFAVLLLSHSFSLIRNFIEKKEFEVENVRNLMTSPYKRVYLMQLTLILLGFGAFLWGEAVLLLLLMIVAKVSTDVYSHLNEHSKLESKEAEAPPEPLVGF